MINLFKASLYKLFREKTFLITMIIGTGLAILLPVMYHFLLEDLGGEYALVQSTSTSSNFGLTVPINLTVMIMAEFTTGSLRNKIIAGNRKSRIYISLLFSGIVFTIIQMTYYIGLSTLMGTILGGFDASKVGGPEFIWKYIALTLCSYIFITALSIFISTIIRNLGASIPLIVIALVLLSTVPLFMMLGELFNNTNETVTKVIEWLDPLYDVNLFNSILSSFNEEATKGHILPGIISSLSWSVVFTVLGVIIFKHRDVK